MGLLKSDYSYSLPGELIAQTPKMKRDDSRLLVYSREDGTLQHKKFSDITEFLRPGDGLVINETKVIPARLRGVRADTGGKTEFLLLRRISEDVWETIAGPAKKARPGTVFNFGPDLSGEVTGVSEGGIREMRFSYSGIFEEILAAAGETPLPPYIKEKLDDPARYQTVYAKEDGSAAAPTAGLHFTEQLLCEISSMGIEIIPVLLHVGLGTFLPVKEENVLDHQMHSEYYEVSEEAAQKIRKVRRGGGRIIAVGTTSVRTLETLAEEDGSIKAGSGFTDIFIFPGYEFKAVDALITNFHLPQSTLLMLVSAFAGREKTLQIYETAVKERYLFFSFGDACLFI